ncbi:hypothetical protein TNCV_25911 [Trichonephila clavipes]|uniref:Uncharacterized protein n=1 Tax=Trichonephila clavipes TaxID=2585209 RepID=A0A8X6W1I8_TRICX|nr:hypothetical protein TNCV_25911 [Trichonephila clavipes]
MIPTTNPLNLSVELINTLHIEKFENLPICSRAIFHRPTTAREMLPTPRSANPFVSSKNGKTVDEFITSTFSISQNMKNSLEGWHVRSLYAGGRCRSISPAHLACTKSMWSLEGPSAAWYSYYS